jgi:SAM-dependent methyltransferase
MSELERWNDRYAGGDTPWDTGKPSSELVRVLNEEEIAPCLAIDLGCGTGTNVLYLAERGFDVTGVDFSPLAIERCRQRAGGIDPETRRRTRFLVADLFAPPRDIGGPYEFFFDRGCYHVVRRTDLQGYLNTLKRITAGSAAGLVLTGNARELMQPGPPVVTEEEIRAELGQVFEVVRLREFRFDPLKDYEAQPLAWSCLLRRHVVRDPAAH